MTNFYKKDGSYYKADDNSKILNPTDLQALSKAGGKEVSYTTDGIKNAAGELVNPTQKDINDFNSKNNTFNPTTPNTPLAPSINNNYNSTTLKLGLTTPDIISSLPKDNSQATLDYSDNAIKQAQEAAKKAQDQLNQYSSANEQNLKNLKATEQTNLSNSAIDSTKQMTVFNDQLQPLRDKLINFTNESLTAATSQNAKDVTNHRIALANENATYADLMKQSINETKNQVGLASINNGQRNSLLNDYKSKIEINNAAISALDGNINLASTILNNASASLQSSIANQSSFNMVVNQLFSNKDAISKSNIADYDKQIADIEANKKTIMDLMNTNPIITNKAGITLTDTPEQTTQKLNAFYVKNPQYAPDNQAWIKKAMDKYFDAGISTNDSLETVKSKISMSKIYQNENDNTKNRNIQKIGVDENNNDVYGYYDPATNSIVKVNINGTNTPADTSNATLDDFVNAISGQESGGNYNAVNDRTGASGKFQILPSNWPTWSREYAKSQLGVDTELEPTPTTQDNVAKWKMEQYYSKYGNWADVASAWYSGRPFSQVISEGWADKKQGNGNEPSVREYVNSVIGRMTNSTSSDFTTGQGYNQKQWDTAKSMMSPGSTLTLEGIKQADRPGVNIALNKLKEQAKQSGDIYGVMKASAGGAKIDATTVKDLAKFGTSITQLDSLKKEIDDFRAKGGTGAFKGRINEQKFWDADVATIKAKLQGVIPTIARGIFSEVGVLTDQDIENYKNTIPNIKTPDEAINRIFEGLMETIDSKILNTYESYANAGYDVSGFADTYKSLKTKIDNAKYPVGTVVSVNGKKYKSLGNGQFDEIK